MCIGGHQMQDTEFYSRILSGIENLLSKKEKLESSLVKETNEGFINASFIKNFLDNIKIIDDALDHMEKLKQQQNISSSLNKKYGDLFQAVIQKETDELEV